MIDMLIYLWFTHETRRFSGFFPAPWLVWSGAGWRSDYLERRSWALGGLPPLDCDDWASQRGVRIFLGISRSGLGRFFRVFLLSLGVLKNQLIGMIWWSAVSPALKPTIRGRVSLATKKIDRWWSVWNNMPQGWEWQGMIIPMSHKLNYGHRWFFWSKVWIMGRHRQPCSWQCLTFWLLALLNIAVFFSHG